MSAPIKCLHTAVWPIDKFLANPKNPNRHPERQIELLAQIIEVRGWRAPIVVSKESGFVVKGHGRLAAAKFAAMTEAPVEIQSYASPAEELADMIADNRIAELAEIDTPAQRELLEQLEPGLLGRLMAGYTEDEFDQMVAAAPSIEDDSAPPADDTPPPTSGTGHILRFGSKTFPLSDDELKALNDRAAAYMASERTAYGFVRRILGMA